MSSQQQPPLTETIADKAKDNMENAKQTLSNAGQHIVDGIKYALHLDNAAGVKYAYVVGRACREARRHDLKSAAC